MMDNKVSGDKHISRWFDIENSSMIGEIASETMDKEEAGDR